MKKVRKLSQRLIWPADTEARIREARNKTPPVPWWAIGQGFGTNLITVRKKAQELGIFTPKTKKRFTPEEDAIIRQDWIDNVDIHVTAAKLGRSWGTLQQRLHHFHQDLKTSHPRTPKSQRIFNKYGPVKPFKGVTSYETAMQIGEAIVEAKAAARVAAIEAKEAFSARKITLMFEQIANGRDRNDALFECRAGGASLQELAEALGITRERIRQIYHNTAYQRVMKAKLAAQAPVDVQKPDEGQPVTGQEPADDATGSREAAPTDATDSTTLR